MFFATGREESSAMREDAEWNELADGARGEGQLVRAPELDLVRHLVARHLGVTVDAIASHHRLDLDLGLSVLSVVLVVLDLQTIFFVQLTLDDVRGARTVGQLAALIRCRAARRHG
jgi:acyl carrier protein